MITRRIILKWTARGTGGTAGAGALTAGIYGVLLTAAWSQFSLVQMLGCFVVFGMVGLLIGVPLGLINGLLLGILTRWRFSPLRHARNYRRFIVLGGFVLNSTIICAIAIAFIVTSTPDALQAFRNQDMLSAVTILYLYVPIAVAYVSVQVVNWRCASWYIAISDSRSRGRIKNAARLAQVREPIVQGAALGQTVSEGYSGQRPANNHRLQCL